MDFINKFGTQLASLWNSWSAAQRAGLVVALLAVAATIFGVARWAASPEYVTVAGPLSLQQAADAVTTLDSQGIPNRVNALGTSVQVPRSDLPKARIALGDIISAQSNAAGDLGNSIWDDPMINELKAVRALEAQLSKTITQMQGIRGATVHLTTTKPSMYVRQAAPSKASVTLDLQPNAVALFGPAQAQAIVQLVASSVENLKPENVVVVDTQQRVLSSNGGIEDAVGGQLQYRSTVEAQLSGRVQDLLTQMLGLGRAKVQVSADLDFTKVDSNSTTYDPEAKVKKSETIETDTSSTNRRQAGGPAGASNQNPQLSFDAGSGGGNSKFQRSQIEYETPKVVETRTQLPGTIKRLTVAAVVDLNPPPAADGTAVQPDPTLIEQQRASIEELIKNAVGFDTARGDTISVVSQKLAGALGLAPAAVPTFWDSYGQLLRSGSLGLASLVALLLGWMVIKRMQPIVVETESKQTLSSESVFRLAELSQQSREHPERVAAVFKVWLGQSLEEKAVPPQQQRQRAAA